MSNNDKGNFLTLQTLRLKYPIGQPGWYATVGELFYVWDQIRRKWSNGNSIATWGSIGGDINSQTDLIDYINDKIESTEIRYPKDYISPTETIEIRQYENYAIWNPLVNDGILINDGTLIIN